MPDIRKRSRYYEQEVTPYQWKVYDFIKTIPKGRVTTYKTVCECIGGSPRSGELRSSSLDMI